MWETALRLYLSGLLQLLRLGQICHVSSCGISVRVTQTELMEASRTQT